MNIVTLNIICVLGLFVSLGTIDYYYNRNNEKETDWPPSLT